LWLVLKSLKNKDVKENFDSFVLNVSHRSLPRFPFFCMLVRFFMGVFVVQLGEGLLAVLAAEGTLSRVGLQMNP